MNSKNFITIQGWMRTELGLKGNDLLVYAIIYGLSQTEDQTFTGSLQYLADWCGATKQGILKNIKNLMEKGLIQKYEGEKNGVKFCEYSCMVLNLVERGIKLSLTNNINNNKDKSNCNSKELQLLAKNGNGKKFELSRQPVLKKPSLYNSCVSVIDSFTQDTELRKSLITYLLYRLEVREKPLYLNMWKGIINKLVGYSLENQLLMVQQSIERGYLSFYDLKKGKPYRNSEPTEGTGCEQDNEQDKANREMFVRELHKQGKRVEF